MFDVTDLNNSKSAILEEFDPEDNQKPKITLCGLGSILNFFSKKNK
jgi:hypothetical protein